MGGGQRLKRLAGRKDVMRGGRTTTHVQLSLHVSRSLTSLACPTALPLSSSPASPPCKSLLPQPFRISVKSLSDKTNVPLLATEIVEKCKLIHPSKVGGV